MRTTVAIDEVEVDPVIGVLVRPRIAAAEHYEYIYRAASGVRWQHQKRALIAYELSDLSPVQWFHQIVASVQSEYGQVLELRPDTRWTNVSESERRQMEQPFHFAQASDT